MLENVIQERIENYKKHEENPVFLKDLNDLLSKNDENALYERFYKDLEFGTAGLRGMIGAGTNRMNSYVIAKATQGISNYLINTFPSLAKEKKLKAVIAYDSRNNSAEFAKMASLIFAGNGITTYLFSSMRATPELSFAIRKLKCHTGVVVTASHNPPEYNGYKAYWSDGVQITYPHDECITNEVSKVVKINSITEKKAIEEGLLKIIDAEIDEPYIASLLSFITEKKAIDKIKIVYTPLHGVGAKFVEKVLETFNVFTVPEQRDGDGNFPTVEYPNPEDPKALTLAIEYAKKENANILMATDPDADRFACGIKDAFGNIQLLTGNQIGVLFFDYLCQTKLKNISSPLIVRSIVSTHMVDKIAEKYGVKVVASLTGFKWICGIAEKEDIAGKNTYIYGFEESFGYNFANGVKDKDGIAASLIFAELAAYWLSKGKSVLERLEELFKEYGLFMEKTINKTYQGSEGVKIMQNIMKRVRDAKLSKIANTKVIKIKDVLEGYDLFIGSNKIVKIDLPKSNVLQYFMEDGSIISLRPSGTEPKIKAYIVYQQEYEKTKENAEKKVKEYETFLTSLLGE
ncbi:MAG: phospho-sugar mutase [Treponema sp.]